MNPKEALGAAPALLSWPLPKWTEERPWGRFATLIENQEYKLKILEVLPGKRLSYQSHTKRKEAWTVAKGEAVVILDDQEFILKAGDQIEIQIQAKHRLENRSTQTLQVIEVQIGTYFGEDDITRYQDDFKRA